MSRNDLISKEKEIKKEINRIKKLFKDLSKDSKQVAEGLIEEAGFMRATLNELKQDIKQNGAIDEMQQGDYSITRESPSIKTYNTMIQRYTTVWKAISDLLPREVPKPEDDGFDDFVNGR
ncbi:hypothetical protein [Fredinandcohnia sp. 179-A 10B2 NHS]|uniref:hypothetical protein n=1 Tax=Fredinandcohnia sp. 179-A 10B2 NHS TaxID=3235176 RepID=UPI0039A1149D